MQFVGLNQELVVCKMFGKNLFFSYDYHRISFLVVASYIWYPQYESSCVVKKFEATLARYDVLSRTLNVQSVTFLEVISWAKLQVVKVNTVMFNITPFSLFSQNCIFVQSVELNQEPTVLPTVVTKMFNQEP